jgi:hypothetical protein
MVVTIVGGRPVHHFAKGPQRKRKARENPELALQIAVKQYLDAALPANYLWTASAAGVRVAMHTATQMKAAGIKRGFPDILILSPRGGVVWIELKAKDGSLLPEQKAFRDHCQATGRDIWALARSVDDVEAALKRWGVEPRCSVNGGSRYAIAD